MCFPMKQHRFIFKNNENPHEYSHFWVIHLGMGQELDGFLY